MRSTPDPIGRGSGVENEGRLLRAWLSCLGVVLVAATLALGGQWACEYSAHRPFEYERDRWLARDDRLRMADSVLAHVLHNGMTRAEVVALLGPPDKIEDGTLRYDLGEHGTDERWMYVGIGDDDRVHGFGHVHSIGLLDDE